jgi:hypothetical protein
MSVIAMARDDTARARPSEAAARVLQTLRS